jgi:hypothetical protein
VRLLREGALSYEQVRSIERGVRTLPEQHREHAVVVLNEAAKGLNIAELWQTVRHLQNVVDPDGSAKTAAERFDRRYLHLSPLLDGMVALDGLLDGEAAALLDAALEPFLVPASPDDERTTPQRRADGLIDVARVAMEQAKLGSIGGTRPQLSILCPANSVDSVDSVDSMDSVDSVDAAGEKNTCIDLSPGNIDSPAGTALTKAATARIRCDSIVSRVLPDAESIPLDLGRATRLFSADQRRMMSLRDGGCRFPGCGLPPAFTDAHHIVAWQVGGRSDMRNGVLM